MLWHKAIALLLLSSAMLPGQSNSYLDPTRPTISSDAAIQQKGVLQIESGYDAYFLPYDQTGATSFYYALTNWLRLDAGVSAWRATEVGVARRTQGVGDVQFGAKAILFHDGRSHILPGLAVQYTENAASASTADLRSRYYQGTLILSNTVGRWRWKVNGALIGYHCRQPSGCGLRGQGAAGITYKWSQKTSLVTETYGQSVSVSAPPGAYQLTGFTHQFAKHFSLNGGVRFGLNSSAPTIGATVGLTVGVGGEQSQQ